MLSGMQQKTILCEFKKESLVHFKISFLAHFGQGFLLTDKIRHHKLKLKVICGVNRRLSSSPKNGSHILGEFKKRINIAESKLPHFKLPKAEGGSVLILLETTNCYQHGLQEEQ